MRKPISARLIALSLLLLLALVAVPTVVAVSAQGEGTEAQLHSDAYQRDGEVVFINRNDGKIVIRDYAVGANMLDFNAKYDGWGGNWREVAAGDFNGDGNREIVAIGGRPMSYTGPEAGPTLKVFDPGQGTTSAALYTVELSGFDWLMVRTGDLDGDGRAEIVALRSASETGGINARLVAYEFEGSSWREKWNFPNGGGFHDIDVGDTDGDGKADIAGARVFNYIVILDGENPATSHFEAKVGGLAEWRRVRIGDVTGDNAAELTLMRPQQASSGNYPAAVQIIHPKTGNTWDDIFGWGFGDPPEDIELANINADAAFEILAFNNGNLARIYALNPRLADSNNNRTEEELWVGDNEWGPNLVVGDPNGDGKTERALMRKDTGVIARILSFEDNGAAKDEGYNGPYTDKFIIANLDSTGILVAPRLVVPTTLHFYYDLTDPQARQTVIQVANGGAGTFTWTASQGVCPWLIMTPPAPPPTVSYPAGDTLTFALQPVALASFTAGQSAQCDVAIQAISSIGPPMNQTITIGVTAVNGFTRLWLPLSRR